MRRTKLGTRLSLAMLLVGLLPLVVASVTCLLRTSRALHQQSFDLLVSVRDSRKAQIEGYFGERLADATVLAASTVVAQATEVFERAFVANGSKLGSPEWQAAKVQYGPWFEAYVKTYGYYDLFLIAADGDIVYTVCEEADEGQSLQSDALADSSLTGAVTAATSEPAMGDFEPYAPSNGEPAAFVAAPVPLPGGQIGHVALQLSIDGISGVMQQRAGMGQTGESYLVGSDKRMRSDSLLDQEHRSVEASFAGTVEQNGVDTVASREALAGKTDAILTTDYRGGKVLSAFCPIAAGGLTWALLAEIDQAEAFAALTTIRWTTIGLILLSVVAILVVALGLSRSIARPIDYAIDGLTTASSEVATASGQVSTSSQQLAAGASQQASSLEETSAALEEMASMTHQSAEGAGQAETLMADTRNRVEQGQREMTQLQVAIGEIRSAADETAKIVKAIDEISFQTNLLALNAAVEAARAGDAGKGFAVVAEEVRNLAQRCSKAASDTSELIAQSVQRAGAGVELAESTAASLVKITQQAQQVSTLIAEVAGSAKQQAVGIEQVNTAVAQMDQVTQDNAANAEESASASEELSAQAQELTALVALLAQVVGRSTDEAPAPPRPILHRPEPKANGKLRPVRRVSLHNGVEEFEPEYIS